MSEPGADPGAELELGAAPSRRRIAPIIVLAVAAVLAGLFWVLAVSRSGTADELGVVDSPLIGRPAPSLRGTTIDGEPFDLARRKGSWVVLNFFQSDCVPCKAEHPELVKFVEQQATFDNGAELYTIAQDIDAIQRRLGDKDVPVFDQLGHKPIDKRQQQRRDVMPVAVRIHQQKNPPVPQPTLVVLVAHPAAQRRDDVRLGSTSSGAAY